MIVTDTSMKPLLFDRLANATDSAAALDLEVIRTGGGTRRASAPSSGGSSLSCAHGRTLVEKE